MKFRQKDLDDAITFIGYAEAGNGRYHADVIEATIAEVIKAAIAELQLLRRLKDAAEGLEPHVYPPTDDVEQQLNQFMQLLTEYNNQFGGDDST
jgi:hypothetical protein